VPLEAQVITPGPHNNSFASIGSIQSPVFAVRNDNSETGRFLSEYGAGKPTR